MNADLYAHTERPCHPGEILREDFIPQYSISRKALASHLGLGVRTLGDLVNERRPITLDLALRLGEAFGTGAHYWLGLQMQHDVWVARRSDRIGIAKLSSLKSKRRSRSLHIRERAGPSPADTSPLAAKA